MVHVGQTEEIAGQGAGKQFKAAGAKKVLVVIHELGHYFVGLRYPDDFLDRRLALQHSTPAVLAQGQHALGNGGLFQLAAVALFHDEALQRFGDEADFVNREPPLIAGVPAILTAGPAVELEVRRDRRSDFVEVLQRIAHLLFAVRTNRANEPLGEKRFHDRSEQERLDVHIDQARDAADGVVRVQGAEDEVTGHGRSNGDVRRLDVANLSDHDDVRILSQDMTQSFGKGEVDLRFHVDLRHARQPIFHRLLDCDDPPLDRIDAAEEAIKRRRFSAA